LQGKYARTITVFFLIGEYHMSVVRPSIRRAFADISTGQVHYATCGDTAAPVVLLLHQSPRSWREFQQVLPLLGLRWRVIAMDTAGFGDSDPLPQEATVERWAVAAHELLDVLGISRAHVVGHHTGGVIALEMAAAFGQTVTSLVLSSIFYNDAAFRQERSRRPKVDKVSFSVDGSHLTALWQGRQAFYPPDRPDLLQAFMADALRAADDPYEGHRVVGLYRMEERIGLVKQPVLIMTSELDPTVAHAQALQSCLPHAQQVTIADGRVPLPDHMPEVFAQEVLRFLDRLPQET